MKLLIVDDEPIIRKGIRKLIDFESLGINEVYEAANGQTAYELFLSYEPEIILADINMPKMNGLEFAEKVKGVRKSTKIALITGYDYFDYAQKALKLGVEDYILKPVSRKDIQQLLAKLSAEVLEEAKKHRVTDMVDAYQKVYGRVEDQGYKGVIADVMEKGISDPDFSMSALSDQLGLSSGYVSGLFRKYFQVTFKEYLMTKRMEKAELLLLSTEMKNYEVSEAVGFKDANYFGTVFRKHAGMTPGQYREKARSEL